MQDLRKHAESSSDWAPELDDMIEVVDCGMRTFASYVGAVVFAFSVVVP
jgi:hypothetical protein